jgi:hypothetical protein
LFIHYYIYIFFRLKKYLPESFLRREFLPVGATDTKFFYDYLEAGDYLELETDQSTLNKYNIYVTLYDYHSLPFTWFKMENPKQKSSSIKNKGYYLIRVRTDYEDSNKFNHLNLKISKMQNQNFN